MAAATHSLTSLTLVATLLLSVIPCSSALVAAVRPPPVLRGGRFFLDTADTMEWAALLPLGIFHGVTTNPVLLQRAAVPCSIDECHRLASTAFELGAREFMAQAWGGGSDALVASGLALARVDPQRIVVKVPVTAEGTRAASELVAAGVRVCLTACYSREQALVATAVGAEYLAPYLGRMCDAGRDGHAEVEAMHQIARGLGGGTRIFAASIRSASSLARLAAAGLDTFTFSPGVARELFADPLTAAAAASFEEAAGPWGGATAHEANDSTAGSAEEGQRGGRQPGAAGGGSRTAVREEQPTAQAQALTRANEELELFIDEYLDQP